MTRAWWYEMRAGSLAKRQFACPMFSVPCQISQFSESRLLQLQEEARYFVKDYKRARGNQLHCNRLVCPQMAVGRRVSKIGKIGEGKCNP
jgi:hypothetical protein